MGPYFKILKILPICFRKESLLTKGDLGIILP